MHVQLTSRSPEDYKLFLLHSDTSGNLVIKCGEIDGVVLGPWATFSENGSVSVDDDDNAVAGYWAAAAVWSNTWDQRTIDRVSHRSSSMVPIHYGLIDRRKYNIFYVSYYSR